MPVELPDDADAFDALLRRRIRDQQTIDALRAQASRGARPDAAAAHVVGQSGCFCLDCLLHRKQEWRVWDVNPTIVGPRDRWKQYTWGNAERRVLGDVDDSAAEMQPFVTPTVREKITVRDAKQRQHIIERDAKFTAVSALTGESAGVLACGDNTYGALGSSSAVSESPVPTQVDLSHWKGRAQQIAASAYASFVLVVAPPTDDKPKRKPEARPLSRPGLFRRKSIDDVLDQLKNEEVVYNYLVSWGRGDRGILGHCNSSTSFSPRAIDFFNTMRVLQVCTGAQHVLVLTEMNGVYAFGDGSHGKLGVGDTIDRNTPVQIRGLDDVNVISVSAGDEHSIAVAGEVLSNRQVYSWGHGKNGRLGHNDDQTRTKPTRINHFRGRKVISVSAGGAHNLARSEMPDGICVWSWGAGTYGQLGHRETWDAWLPRSIDELRREMIRFVDAGENHSIALSESRQLWAWGKGIHGNPDVERPDPASWCVVQPIKVELPGIQIINVCAGRGRTFVWGDRAVDKKHTARTFGGSAAAKVCCALPDFEAVTSDSFRIVYRCGGCSLDDICIACAHKCHAQHCLELEWTLDNALSRDCACYSSGKCIFVIERGVEGVIEE